MNIFKNSFLVLVIVSAPLMAMDLEAPRRTNPCTQLKAALVLGFALFAGKTAYDYQAVSSDALIKPVTAGGNQKTLPRNYVVNVFKNNHPQCPIGCLNVAKKYAEHVDVCGSRELELWCRMKAGCPETVHEADDMFEQIRSQLLG